MIKSIIEKIKSLFKKDESKLVIQPKINPEPLIEVKKEEPKENLFNEWELGTTETPKKKRPYKRKKKASDKPKEEKEDVINKEEEVKKPKKKYYKKRKPKADKGE